MEQRIPDGFSPWEGFVLKPGVAKKKKYGKVYRMSDFSEDQEPTIGVDEGATYWRMKEHDLIVRVDGGYLLNMGRGLTTGWYYCSSGSFYLGRCITWIEAFQRIANASHIVLNEWCVGRAFVEERGQLKAFLIDDSIRGMGIDIGLRYHHEKGWREVEISYLFRICNDIYAVQVEKFKFNIFRLNQSLARSIADKIEIE